MKGATDIQTTYIFVLRLDRWDISPFSSAALTTRFDATLLFSPHLRFSTVHHPPELSSLLSPSFRLAFVCPKALCFGFPSFAISSGRAIIELVVSASTSYEFCIWSVGRSAETPLPLAVPTGVKYLVDRFELPTSLALQCCFNAQLWIRTAAFSIQLLLPRVRRGNL